MFWSPGKYANGFADPNEGVPLYWGVQRDGYAVRAKGPFAIEKEQVGKIRLHPYARSRVLEVPRQLYEYQQIVDWIAATRGHLRFEERVPDPSRPGVWWVWMTWFDVQGTLPAGAAVAPPTVPITAPTPAPALSAPTYTFPVEAAPRG